MRIRQVRKARERENAPVCVPKRRGGKSREKSASLWWTAILQNPNLIIQLMVIAMTFISDQGKMERGIDGVTTTAEKLKNVADLLKEAMGSVRSAAETPRRIRKLLE